jgi:hypothetical protein
VNDERAARPLRIEMQIEIAERGRVRASFVRDRTRHQQAEQEGERPASVATRPRVRPR